jgi:organic radical activating enzyme
MPVFWNWELLYVCNYRCSYCKYTTDGWDTYEHRNVFPGMARLRDVWKRMHDLYGRNHVAMSGGEPSVHPHFWGLCAMLASVGSRTPWI